ncbi:hypothetical protein [Methanopyrus sp.]
MISKEGSDVLTAALAGAIGTIVAPIDGKELLPGIKPEAGPGTPTVTAEPSEGCGITFRDGPEGREPNWRTSNTSGAKP